MSALDDFAPHSADEDIRNLRELHETFRRLRDRDISIEQAMEKVRRLPGHRELKDRITTLMTTPNPNPFTVETIIMDTISVEISYVSPPLAETNLIGSDSDPEWSALYEDISDDELADMSTDEEDEEDRPPLARRVDFFKLRL